MTIRQWWTQRRRAKLTPPIEALQAANLAERKLELAQAQRREVDQTVENLKRLHRQNHLAEAIMQAMTPRRRSPR